MELGYLTIRFEFKIIGGSYQKGEFLFEETGTLIVPISERLNLLKKREHLLLQNPWFPFS